MHQVPPAQEMPYDPFAKEKANAQKFEFPPIIDGPAIELDKIVLPKEIIQKLFSLSEKLELAGGSKSFKTWSFIDLALSVSNGAPWWGMATNQTHVLYLNLELSRPFFEERLSEICSAKRLAPTSYFHVMHLRGAKLHQHSRWEAFLGTLQGQLSRFPDPLLIVDPIYKMLGGRNENSAGDINAMMDQLEDLVQRTRGSNVFGHHFAKGNASDKEAIDRASGSGVFQRDPDVLLLMTKNETQDCYTIESFLRNHRPIEKFVLHWNYPLFMPRSDVDPEELKKPTGRGPKYKPIDLTLLLGAQSLYTREFEKLARDELGLSHGTFFSLLKKCETLSLIFQSGITKQWERTKKNTLVQ